MSKVKMLRIDGERLSRALAERGLTPKSASEAMRMYHRYLDKCISAGWISAHAAVALEFAAGVRREKYVIE